MNRRFVHVLAGLGLVAGAMCARDVAAMPTEHPNETPSTAMKSPIKGLVSMGAYKFASHDGAPEFEPENTLSYVRSKTGLLQAIVIVASWRNLEKSATSGLTPDNQIDRGLEEVRKYNKENPATPLTVKLRVWGGSWAPAWAMDASGGQVAVVHTNNKNVQHNRTIGHVWSDAYHTRWAHLQELLAAKYDSEPLIHEVAATSCMMFTAEPFSIDTTPAAVLPLRKAGLTDAAYKTCLNRVVDDYKPWKTTRFEMPLNPLKLTDAMTDAGGKPKHDEAFTLSWMAECHKREPIRCAFDNHDLDVTLDGDLEKTVDAMGKSGAEVEFQMGPTIPSNLDAAMKNALRAGASSVELWQDFPGFTAMADADLKKYAKLLEKNR